MRVLFDARGVREQSDGLSNYVRHILTWLLRLDQQHEYLVLTGPAMQEHLKQQHLDQLPNLRIVTTHCPFMGPLQQTYMPWFIRRLPKADVFHYPHFDLPVLAHPRSVITIHDLNHITMNGYFRSHKRLKRFYSMRTTALAVNKARCIFADSLATKAQLLATFPWLNPQKIMVVYQGPGDAFTKSPQADQVEEFRSKYRLGKQRYLLYVGTDRPHKNLLRVLTAYAQLRRTQADLQPFLLVGPLQSDSQVERAIAQLGLKTSVRQIGYISDAELPLVYQVADAFVFCSLAEGFGIPLVEAMACGVPIVTSNLSATAEVASDSAVLVDPYSVDSIAEGLHRLLSSEELRRTLIANGHNRIAQFSWERAARSTLDIYRSVTA